MANENAESGIDTTIQSPRESLAKWANASDEWIRRIVRHILDLDGPIAQESLTLIYQLLLEENGIQARTISQEPLIEISEQPSAQLEPFHLTRISEVKRVNALVEDGQIDFAPGLTLLFGENGTGKTGYARILKCIAGSRSSDAVLPDINQEDPPGAPHAEIRYRLGNSDESYQWNGEGAQFPFSLMSVFDSPSAELHIDSDLDYTYRPSALTIFDRVTDEVRKIRDLIEKELQSLKPDNSTLLSRFHSQSSIYPFIQSVGAVTDLTELQEMSKLPDKAADLKGELDVTIARLVADTVGQEIGVQEGVLKLLTEASEYLSLVLALNAGEYNTRMTTLASLRNDQATLRETLFTAANLPAEPDQTWESFVRAGKTYREHLETLGVHDDTRCLYCRQVLNLEAVQLIEKYSDYLDGQIAKDIEEQQEQVDALVQPLIDSSLAQVRSYLQDSQRDDYTGPRHSDERMELLRKVSRVDETFRQQVCANLPLEENDTTGMSEVSYHIGLWISEINASLDDLRGQNTDRDQSLKEKRSELGELEDRMELKDSWVEVGQLVATAQRLDKLSAQRTKITGVLRKITDLSKEASEQLVNNNFQQIFSAECAELRVPALKLEFLGREGQAQRRKTLPGDHRPSKVLSEGEQKVLAIADFISEVRVSDQMVPVIFDDPVSSLDHRRVQEVSHRIANLALERQVVVFSHDIFFVSSLLALLEKSGRCIYYRVTDDDGKGSVSLGTGPRWDTVSRLTGRVNESIQKAKNATGEEREDEVREAYSRIRSWSEVFVEREVLAQVTERYQPHVRMTALGNIKVSVLEETIETVTSVFEDACRYIDGHSQPLSTLYVAPTLPKLEKDWETLKGCRDNYLKASS